MKKQILIKEILTALVMLTLLHGCAALDNLRQRAVGEPQFKTSKEIEKGIEKRGFEDVYIRFDYNQYVIRKSEYPQMKELAEAIRTGDRDDDEVYLLVGHTDSIGPEDYNLELSKKRAESVKEMLVKRYKIDPNLLVTEGRGELELAVDPENGPEDQAINRRVQIMRISQRALIARRERQAREAEIREQNRFKPKLKVGQRVSYQDDIGVETDDCTRILFFGRVCHTAHFTFEFGGRIVGVDQDGAAYRVKIQSARLRATSLMGGPYRDEAESRARSRIGQVRTVEARYLE